MITILERIRSKSLAVRNRLVKQDLNEVRLLDEMIQTSPRDHLHALEWTRQVAELMERNLLDRISKKDIALILAGLVSFRNTEVTPQMSHLALMRAYENTSGLMQQVLHRILFSENVESSPPVMHSKFFNDLSASEIVVVLSELKEQGYAVLPRPLHRSWVGAFIDEAKSLSYTLRNPDSDEQETSNRKIDPLIAPRCVAAYANSSDLSKNRLFKEFSNDPLLLHLASMHMGSSAHPIDSTLWYSFASSAPSGDAAQMFHYDLDTLRWLKVFVYLTDVGPRSGPHEFVPASHKPGGVPIELMSRGYARLEDQEIDKYCPQGRKQILGQKGTVILGDTRCLHKGNAVGSGYRLIFSPIFAPSRVGYFHGL